MDALHDKLENLKATLRDYGSVAVAFSGGVDSTFLLAVAHAALGDACVAVSIRSGSFPKREQDGAESFCRGRGVRQIVLECDEFAIPGFADNPPDRCYLCKRALFGKILECAARERLAVVCEGSNVDDVGDYRPGMRAIAELGIASPLRDCGLAKQDIRDLSREMGLPTWNKPSCACLASRFAYGEKITPERLARVDRAERFLQDMGFAQVRVRVHGDVARVELPPDDFASAIARREQIAGTLKSYGFAYVALDMQGYRTGSMNETLEKEKK